MNHGSLFSGIGGFDLAAEWMGWNNVFHCEWNPFGQKVLKYHFPKSISYHDITKTDFSIHRGNIDILTGGFPCRPYSTAGLRKGKEDERHLFPEMLRAVKEIQPRWIVGENVRGLVSWNEGLVFHEVYDDLEREGYEVQSFLIPAASVGAPHQRYRVWFVAYTNNKGRGSRFREVQKENGEISKWDNNAEFGNSNSWNVADSNCHRLQGGIPTNFDRQVPSKEKHDAEYLSIRKQRIRFENFPTQPSICGGDDGIPRELDSITFPKWRNESIKAYGNAIVPQVAHQIFKAIKEFEELV